MLLMVAGLALVMLEVFVPSGGMLGLLSAMALTGSIVMAFYNRGAEVGLLFLLVAAIGAPVVLVGAFRWWPYTPMGRRILLQIPTQDEVMPDTPLRRTLREMVGKVGVAKTLMLPSGAVDIDGTTVDALSEGMPIDAGQKVLVVEVRGNVVLVRPYDGPIPSKGQQQPDDVLSQPIESLGLDPLDPLA